MVSSEEADAKEFKLTWNGRVFRLTWTEEKGGKIRHMQTALTRYVSRHVYEQPSSALLRATLINGATNINNTALPNLIDGYGWGRVNLRQSLAPSPPVTFYVRDDNAVGRGQTAQYRFRLPTDVRTRLLRATLCWTDASDNDPNVINKLHFTIKSPGWADPARDRLYHGNDWDAANPHLSRQVLATESYNTTYNILQIVIENPPSGDYIVEVSSEFPRRNDFNQFDAQPFALVFVGSGLEVPFAMPAPAARPVY